MTYHQLTPGERYMLAALRRQGCNQAEIARSLGRHRYGVYDSRGRLAGKRMIGERPPEVESRERVGHWEADTAAGAGSKDCVATLVERKTGLVLVGKLADRTAESLSRRAISLMRRPGARFETVTADNGTEFHGYQRIEARTAVVFYFARAYHSWERGSNENAHGLIRQYLPKGVSMAGLSQQQCNAIARKLNTRPRKRLGFRTPLECFNES
jgi:transposase, IS30 family